MQVVRFSVLNKTMSSVLAGFITDFVMDEWRVRGRFFLGSTFHLMDDWQYRHPGYPVNHVFGLAVVTRLTRGWRDFDKCRIEFEVVEVYEKSLV